MSHFEEGKRVGFDQVIPGRAVSGAAPSAVQGELEEHDLFWEGPQGRTGDSSGARSS